MVPALQASIGVRACRSLVLMSFLLFGLALLAGCSNRRNAYRPIYSTRSSSADCPSGDCGTIVSSPSAVQSQPNYQSSPSGASPAPTPFGFGSNADEEPTDLQPVSPPKGTTGPGAARTKAIPAEPEFVRPGNTTSSRELSRPRIDSNTSRAGIVTPEAPASDTYTLPPENLEEPVLAPPSRTSQKSRKSLLSPAKAGQSRRNLQTFVNDPDDLFTPPRADRPWRYIVLHHSSQPSGSLGEIDADHRERLGTMGCGYHFVVGNGTGSGDGRIEVAARWAEQKGGHHCRDSRVNDINEYGIGICLIGNFDEGKASESQVEATKLLVAYLQERYSIPEGNVVTHDAVAKRDSVCPGKNFPRAQILGRSRGLAQN